MTEEKTLKTDMLNEKKIKRLEILVFSLLFVFYLLVATLYMYYANGIKMNYLFGADISRVFEDWTKFYTNHYRTSVHPLYVLFIYPEFFVLKLFGCSPYFAICLFIAFVSTMNSVLIYKILSKLNDNKKTWVTILFSALYALSFSTIQNSLICESFVCGAFSLLVMTYWAVSIKDKQLGFKDYLVFVLLFILSFSILATNIIIFLIFSFYLFDIKKTYYPYLNIARLHYYQVKINIPDNLKYPISFEYQDWGLKKQAKCSPHGWCAAELFLYLFDYDTF